MIWLSVFNIMAKWDAVTPITMYLKLPRMSRLMVSLAVKEEGAIYALSTWRDSGVNMHVLQGKQIFLKHLKISIQSQTPKNLIKQLWFKK